MPWVELSPRQRRQQVRVELRDQRRERRRARLLGVTCFWGARRRPLLLAIPLLVTFFAILSFGGVYGWAYGSAYILLSLTLILWAVAFLRRRCDLRWHAVYWPMLAVFLEIVGQYLTHHTASASSTLTQMIHLAAAGVLFFLVTQLYRPERDARWLLPVFAVFTALIAALAILQFFSSLGKIYWIFRYSFADPMGTYVNRDHFAGCMELLIPVTVAQALAQRRSTRAFVFWATFPALACAALLLSASRGGAASVLVECILALAVVWNRERRLTAEEKAASRRSMAATFLILASLSMAYVSLVGINRLEARFADLRHGYVTNNTRVLLDRSSFAMWKQRPWLGWGFGAWPAVYPQFALFDDARTYDFAHNDYLQFLSETGLAGGICAIAFLALWGAAVMDRRRRTFSDQARNLGTAAAIACCGILVHSAVDMNLHIPANMLLFYFLAALAAVTPIVTTDVAGEKNGTRPAA
jgi:O-antigen ligase